MMVDHLQRSPDSLPQQQPMDAEAIRNLRAFIAILQEWDRETETKPKITRGCQLIESCFTSSRESGMS